MLKNLRPPLKLRASQAADAAFVFLSAGLSASAKEQELPPVILSGARSARS